MRKFIQFLVLGVTFWGIPFSYGQDTVKPSVAATPAKVEAKPVVPPSRPGTKQFNPFYSGKTTPASGVRRPSTSPIQATSAAPTLPVLPSSVPPGLPTLVPAPTPPADGQSGADPSAQVPPPPVIPACKVEALPFSGKTTAMESELLIRFKATTDKPCLTAVSADDDWVDPQLHRDANTITLYIAANTTAVSRTTSVYVVAGAQGFSYRIRQAAGTAPVVVTEKAADTEKSPAPKSDEAQPAPSAQN